jgi:hypothetical protein
MTNLDNRPVVRETRALDTTRSGRRPLVVKLETGGRVVRIKPKGTRQWYTVPYEELYRVGVRIRAVEIRNEKAERRAARRGVQG